MLHIDHILHHILSTHLHLVFQTILNKERAKEGLKPISFIAVRQRVIALKEIDQLRWFYKECLKYSYKRDKQGKKQSFGKIFWGATRLKKSNE